MAQTKPEFKREILIELARNGLSVNQICRKLGMCSDKYIRDYLKLINDQELNDLLRTNGYLRKRGRKEIVHTYALKQD